MCGGRVVDLSALESATHYQDGYHRDSKPVRWFWEVRADDAKSVMFHKGACWHALPCTVLRHLADASDMMRVQQHLQDMYGCPFSCCCCCFVYLLVFLQLWRGRQAMPLALHLRVRTIMRMGHACSFVLCYAGGAWSGRSPAEAAVILHDRL